LTGVDQFVDAFSVQHDQDLKIRVINHFALNEIALMKKFEDTITTSAYAKSK
jgi:hypothetical protein